MSLENPTALRLGMRGLIEGDRRAVAGRVVCGVTIRGEVCYWNEYNLVAGDGSEATLVFEETEDGPTWKWFRLFDPPRQLNTTALAAMREGDTIDFGQGTARVTLAGRSRVYRVEGRAPDGVETGDLADYLNLELNGRPFVISWTGDEVEYFTGRDLAHGYVERVFGLPYAVGRRDCERSTDYLAWTKYAMWGLFVCVWIATMLPSCRDDASAPEVRHYDAPAGRLADAGTGRLRSRAVRVAGHSVLRRVSPDMQAGEHEYLLVEGDTAEPLLLINGFTGAADHWLWLRRVAPPAGYTGYDAARLRVGNGFRLGADDFRVSELCLVRILSKDGRETGIWNEPIQYGWVGRRNGEWLLARWTAAGLCLYRGNEISSGDVRAALPRQ